MRSILLPTFVVCLALVDTSAAQRFHTVRKRDLPAPGNVGIASPDDSTYWSADLDGDADQDLLFITGLVWEQRPGVEWVDPGDLGLPRDGNSRDGWVRAVGDVDGDGDNDVLGTRELWLNGGTGQFLGGTPWVAVPVEHMLLLDVDGDGDLDATVVYAGDPTTRGTLGLLRNDGSGRFVEVPGAYPPGGLPASGLRGADVDLDGDPDLLVLRGYANPPSLLLNDGTGSFRDDSARLQPAAPIFFDMVRFFDCDLDGDPDFINTWWRPQLFINDGTGHFADESSTRFPAMNFSGDPFLADLDADGDLDFGFTVDVGDSPLHYFNDGSGHFTNSVDPEHRLPRSTMLLSDLDQDGDADAVHAIQGEGFGLARNDGTGRLLEAHRGMRSGYLASADLVDLDGDGDLDAFGEQGFLERSEGTPYLTQVPITPVGSPLRTWNPLPLDVDGDGDLDLIDDNRLFLNAGGLVFQDTGLTVTLSGSTNFEVADVDRDGDPDIIVRPTLWGPGYEVFVLRNDYPAGFVRYVPTTANIALPGEIAVGDVDGDGNPDLLQTDRAQRQGSDQYGRLRFGDGAGGFGRSSIVLGVGPLVRFGDLEGDGDLDIVSITPPGWVGGGLWVHLNDGRGRFTRVPTVQLYGQTTLELLDLDEDGDLDLMLGPSAVGQFIENTGGGVFRPFPFSFTAGAEDNRFHKAGDLDGDGDVDLAFSGHLHVNLTRQLLIPRSVVVGMPFELEAYGPGGGDGRHLVRAAVAGHPRDAGTTGCAAARRDPHVLRRGWSARRCRSLYLPLHGAGRPGAGRSRRLLPGRGR